MMKTSVLRPLRRPALPGVLLGSSFPSGELFPGDSPRRTRTGSCESDGRTRTVSRAEQVAADYEGFQKIAGTRLPHPCEADDAGDRGRSLPSW